MSSKHKAGAFAASAATRQGLSHTVNQDAYALGDREGRLVVVVSDGMGGHFGGEVASRLATDACMEVLETEGGSSASLEKAFGLARERVKAKAEADPGLAQMGATLVALDLGEDGGLVGNVGDSRAYHIASSSYRRITTDHTVAQMMFDRGLLTEDEAADHRERNTVTRCIGACPDSTPDVMELEALDDGVLLLCSDGVEKGLTDDELAGLVRSVPPKQAAEAVVEAAVAGGSRDDVTVVVVWRR